ncbi:MAG: M28 family peptidase [Fimbriimonadaceae bacterium]|nr:M28 family peptidase [Fimbriimonadaceae bacterium]
MKRLALGIASVIVLVAGAAAQYPGSAPVPSEWKRGFESLSPKDFQGWIAKLAGPEFAGRGTGQRGYQLAAEYMAARFKEYGLKPMGPDGSYFQLVPFSSTSVVPGESSLIIGDEQFVFGADFTVAAEADLEAGVVLVRAQTETDTLSEDDAKKLEGKIVILSFPPSDGKPIPAIPAGGRSLRSAVFRAAPAAVLTVVDKIEAPQSSVRFVGGNQGGPTRARMSSGQIARSRVAALEKETDLWEGAGSGALTVSTKTAKLTVKTKTEQVGVPNVVGLFEGSDSVLKEEVVAVGAHLDHLGVQNGVVYPGADDDGSGSSALIGIAKALHSNRQRPKRSVLFLAFCGEEMGLIGSRYYSDNPIVPIDKTLCLYQMDMVARNEEKPDEKASDNLDTIHLVGSKRISTGLHEHVLEVNKFVNFKFEYDEEGVYTRSDHYNFARKGIPIAFFFSGFHPDYHRPTDTMEKLNYEKLTNASKLGYLLVATTANRASAFVKDVAASGGG